MKKIKKIELLNLIANGEEPKIKYNNFILKYNKNEKRFIDKDRLNSLYEIDFSELNDEIEIIEEETKPITKESIEALGYACGEIQKCFTNGWKKSLENKPFKEDKKIEKIKSNGAEFYSEYVGIWISKEETTAYCEFLMNKMNELIDKINSMENKQ